MTTIKVNDFIKASKAYVEKSLAKANTNKNAYLSKSEIAKLPKDLRDNLRNATKNTRGSVRTADFAASFTKYVAANAKKADANKDGKLSAADAARLPKDLQDNFKNYVSARSQVWGDGNASTVKDRTSATRIAEHLAAYGPSKIGYSDAFAKGVKAVLADTEYGPGAQLKEWGGPDGEGLPASKVKAELEKVFNSMTLLPVGEAGETGFEPEKQWVFSIDADVPGDYGFWVAVDRETGEASIENFN